MNNSTIVLAISDKVMCIRAEYTPHDKKAMPAAPASQPYTQPVGMMSHTDFTDTTIAEGDVFKTMDATLRVGDIIAVQASTRHGITVCRVTEVDVEIDLDTPTEIKWVISRINTEAFMAVLSMEAEAIKAVQRSEKQARREKIKKQIIGDNADIISTLAIAK